MPTVVEYTGCTACCAGGDPTFPVDCTCSDVFCGAPPEQLEVTISDVVSTNESIDDSIINGTHILTYVSSCNWQLVNGDVTFNLFSSTEGASLLTITYGEFIIYYSYSTTGTNMLNCVGISCMRLVNPDPETNGYPDLPPDVTWPTYIYVTPYPDAYPAELCENYIWCDNRSCPSGMARYWHLEFSDITNNGCDSCEQLNKHYILYKHLLVDDRFEYDLCNIDGCNGMTWNDIRLTVDTSGDDFVYLSVAQSPSFPTLRRAIYSISRDDFNCIGTNELTQDSNTLLCGMPTTITISPRLNLEDPLINCMDDNGCCDIRWPNMLYVTITNHDDCSCTDPVVFEIHYHNGSWVTDFTASLPCGITYASFTPSQEGGCYFTINTDEIGIDCGENLATPLLVDTCDPLVLIGALECCGTTITITVTE